MAHKGELYLGLSGSELLLSPFGRSCTTKDTEITREGRTASGRYVKDIKAKKKQFVIEWEVISGTDLDTILDIQDIEDELSLVIYTSDTAHDDYTVLMKPIERKRISLTDDGLFSGVSITLDEV